MRRVPDIRRIHSSAADGTCRTTDTLIRDTAIMLQRAGVPVRASKVSRLVRAWSGDLTADGQQYISYLGERLRLTVQQLRQVAWTIRDAFGLPGATGQVAARQADKALGLGGWDE